MFISISNNNPDPLYKQVKDQMKNAIITGELKEGDALPSIRGMANELKISVITIKRAYSELENEGYIITRRGLGSFVNDIRKDDLRREKMGEIKGRLESLLEDASKFDIDIKDIIKLLKEMEGER
ncbi:GntR family transcriptional regulator [Sporosalibacterium faouarense]|uniref:GntR family transcriptional regulator n=1 Tax=Sporosalibacterium faouarense TaxID=516123 RepID=UPI00141C35AA|nr:GntR family transcriptional regulator [Sporosalibacterium faouarense]MTI49636.1 GntR family transcriptional regulator [Bacillota bacterium]